MKNHIFFLSSSSSYTGIKRHSLQLVWITIRTLYMWLSFYCINLKLYRRLSKSKCAKITRFKIQLYCFRIYFVYLSVSFQPICRIDKKTRNMHHIFITVIEFSFLFDFCFGILMDFHLPDFYQKECFILNHISYDKSEREWVKAKGSMYVFLYENLILSKKKENYFLQFKYFIQQEEKLTQIDSDVWWSW